MEYKDLYRMYINLKKENEILKIENKKMRELLEAYSHEIVGHSNEDCIIGENPEPYEEIEQVAEEDRKEIKINNNSTPEDKIQLFMSLFKGRTDVYAKRWINKDGKAGYSPVCINEWKKWICNKPRIKCSQCENRKYSELNFDAVNIL
ncbi:MAG: hypothetical protein ABRQ25_08665 [Clostridiaceae bacterium]